MPYIEVPVLLIPIGLIVVGFFCYILGAVNGEESGDRAGYESGKRVGYKNGYEQCAADQRFDWLCDLCGAEAETGPDGPPPGWYDNGKKACCRDCVLRIEDML